MTSCSGGPFDPCWSSESFGDLLRRREQNTDLLPGVSAEAQIRLNVATVRGVMIADQANKAARRQIF
jgi:hypothetical protein